MANSLKTNLAQGTDDVYRGVDDRRSVSFST